MDFHFSDDDFEDDFEDEDEDFGEDEDFDEQEIFEGDLAFLIDMFPDLSVEELVESLDAMADHLEAE